MSYRGTASPEQFAELHAALVRQCPRDMDSATAQGWIENQAALQRALREALMPNTKQTAEEVIVDVRSQLASWQSRYLGIGIKKDFSNLRIPERSGGFTRLIVVVKELKISELITKLKKEMDFWTYADLKNLDKVKDIVQRPDGDYAIWVRDRQEADEELQNKSADDIQNEGLNTEIFKERILHEWAYFEETGKHLDEKNFTLCTGSRYPDGSVPHVFWSPRSRGVDVYWDYADHRSEFLRARQAVS